MKSIKAFSLTLACLFFSFTINAQGWFKSYDVSQGYFALADMVQTPDGGLVMVGSADYGNGFINGDLFIIKTNELGEEQWRDTIGLAWENESAQAAVLLQDNSIVFHGRYKPDNENGYLVFIKYDLNGNIIDASQTTNGFYSTFAYDMIVTEEGNVAYTGGIWEEESNGGLNEREFVGLMDADLNYITGYSRDNFPADDDYERAFFLVELDGGGFVNYRVLSDGQGSALDGSYMVLQRLNEDSSLDAYIYADTIKHLTVGRNLIKTPDGNLVTSYHDKYELGDTRLRIVKLNSDGEILWTSSLDMTNRTSYKLASVSSGGFIHTSKIHNSGSADNQNIILTRLDDEGNVVWERMLEIPSIATAFLFVGETVNNGFVISGTHRLDPTPGAPHYLFQIKTDSLGQFLLSNINGQLVHDETPDCVVGIDETPMDKWIVVAENSSNRFIGLTDATGYYSIAVDTGEYVVRFTNPANPFWGVCTDETPVSIENIGDTVTVDMAAQPPLDCAVMDVDIHTGFLRPCFENWISVAYTNRGTALAEDAILEVEFDGDLNPVSATLPYSYSGNIVSFDLGDIEPNESGNVVIKVDLDCGDIVGTIHCISATSEPSDFCGNTNLPNGITPYDEICVASTAAYDPNDKRVNPEGEGAEHFIPNDTTLSYLIRFQNTGTDTAFNVYIIDTLSEYLDINTLRPGASSHSYDWEIYGDGILRFTFNDILLPDSNVNEALSHGFVAFEIQPRAQLLPGTVIENTVGIIFDYNAPIITNTVFNTIVKPVYQVEEFVSICDGESFNGVAIEADTIIEERVETAWYDSIYIYHVELLPHISNAILAIICEGETYAFNGQNLSQSGGYEGVFTAFNGCDSTVTLTLEVLPVYTENITAQICDGDTYFFHGQSLNTAGTFETQLQAFNGCDSTVILELEILNSYSEVIEAEICNGETFEYNGESLTTTGAYEYPYTALNGCDSLVTVNLNVLATPVTVLSIAICEGETYTLGSQLLSQSGNYEEVFTAFNGCDSTVNLSLAVLLNVEENIFAQICEDDTYLFDGEELSETGIYQATFNGVNGCDSLAILDLEVLPSLMETLTASICEGETYLFDGQDLSEAGQYEASYVTSFGCDSTVMLDLEILLAVEENISASICEGEIYEFNGEQLSEAGEFQATFIGYNGCDSIVTLFLGVEVLPQDEISASICEGDMYDFYGEILTDAGVYTTNVSNTGMCDSVITLELNVLENMESVISVELCEGDTMIFNGQTIVEGGFYEALLVAFNGCDSLVSLTVSSLPVFTSDTTIALTVGMEYNGITVTGDTTIVETYVAQNGCDSMVMVNIEAITSTHELTASALSAEAFPSPFSESVHVELQLVKSSIVSMSIVDVMGRQFAGLLNKELLQEGRHSYVVNTQDWASGIYLIYLSTESNIKVLRVVKD